MNRLEGLDQDLAHKLQLASTVKRRAASLTACEFAVLHAGIENLLVTEVVEKMRSFKPASAHILAISSLVGALDKRYFDLKEAAEKDADSAVECDHAFSQARAVAAILSALKGDWCEAVYEASFTVDKPRELFGAISKILE